MGFQARPASLTTKLPTVAEENFIWVICHPGVIGDYEGDGSSLNQMSIFVIYKYEACATVFQDIADFMWLESCVNRCYDGPCSKDAEVCI